MAEVKTFQRAFVGGELSPDFTGRVDDPNYQNGCELLQNMLSTPHGPARSRPGTEVVRVTKDSTKRTRLITFDHSSDEQIAVEIGEGHFRFHSNGVTVTNTVVPPTYVVNQEVTMTPTSADISTGADHDLEENAGVIFTVDSGALTPELVAFQRYFAIVVSPTVFQVAAAPGGTPITIVTVPAGVIYFHRDYGIGTLVNFGGTYYVCRDAPTWGGPAPTRSIPPVNGAVPQTSYWHAQPVEASTGAVIYEVPNTYREAHIPELNYDQSGDVMVITHRYYTPFEFRRYAERYWTVAAASFSSSLSIPTGVAGTPTYGLVVDVDVTTGPGAQAVIRVPFATTAVAIGYGNGEVFRLTQTTTGTFNGQPCTGDYVVVADNAGTSGRDFLFGRIEDHIPIANSELGGSFAGATARLITAGVNQTTSYKVTAVDGIGSETEASAASASVDNNLSVSGSFNTVSWGAVAGAVRYRIYREESGLYGLIGESDSASFKDDRIEADMGRSPPIRDTSFSGTSTTSVTFDLVLDLVGWTGHGLAEGAPIFFKTTLNLPGGIEPARVFFVRNPTANAFALSTTPDGALINLTAVAGSYGEVTAASGNWPSAVSHFEQRRCFAGQRTAPQGFWATRSGTDSDLSYRLQIPIPDDDRIRHNIKTRQPAAIRHIVPMAHLLLLANSGEIRVTPLNTDALTPTSFAARPQSYVGSSYVRPSIVNGTLVFVDATGSHVFETGFQATSEGFVPVDLALRASHLFEGYTITDMTRQKSPMSILWLPSSSGKLLGFTFIPEHQIAAWHQHTTGPDERDDFESSCVVYEGGEERLYVATRRTIGGVTVRFIERMASMRSVPLVDRHCVDCGVTLSTSSAVTTVSGLGHLNGETVSVLANGLVQAPRVVAGGLITLATPLAAGPNKVHAGLPFDAKIITLPATAQVEAFAKGRRKNVTKVWIQTHESGSFDVGPSATDLVPSDPYGEVTTLVSQEVDVTLLGNWNPDGQIVIQQSDPLPLSVVSIAMQISLGGS